MSSETKAGLGWKRIFAAFIYVPYFLYSNQSLTFVKQRERHRQREREGKKEGYKNTQREKDESEFGWWENLGSRQLQQSYPVVCSFATACQSRPLRWWWQSGLPCVSHICLNRFHRYQSWWWFIDITFNRNSQISILIVCYSIILVTVRFRHQSWWKVSEGQSISAPTPQGSCIHERVLLDWWQTVSFS